MAEALDEAESVIVDDDLGSDVDFRKDHGTPDVDAEQGDVGSPEAAQGAKQPVLIGPGTEPEMDPVKDPGNPQEHNKITEESSQALTPSTKTTDHEGSPDVGNVASLNGTALPDKREEATKAIMDEASSAIDADLNSSSMSTGLVIDLDADTSKGACSRFKGFSPLSRGRRSLQEVLDHLRTQKETQTSKLQTKYYKCGMENCDFRGTDEDTFRIHTLTKHASESFYACAYCSIQIPKVEELVAHTTKEHVSHMVSAPDGGLYKCLVEKCSAVFTRLGDFKGHALLSHGNEKEFKCCFCFQAFPNVVDLITHMHSHISKVMRCPYCSQPFTLKADIMSHLKDAHPGQPKKINMSVRIVTSSLQSQKSADSAPASKEDKQDKEESKKKKVPTATLR